MADALGRAMLDYQRGGLRGECIHRDGDDTWDGNVAGFYFTPPAEWRDATVEMLDSLAGPVLDAGCGAGGNALWLQEQGREVVGIDVSPAAVQVARERGVDDARTMDMFDLQFPPDRFRSVLCKGTQLGLAGSFAGVRQFLSDLAVVTDSEGVAVVDNYDPAELDAESFGGYRGDPRDGVARRTFHVEYHREADGERERLIGESLSFLLFGPDRLRDAVVGTPWEVAGTNRPGGEHHYRARLEK